MTKELAVIILAAGKGTRMKSDLPKVLHKVAGSTMLSHVIAVAEQLGPLKKIVVVSPGSAEVEKAANGCEIAIQQKQLGTGDAVKATKTALNNFTGNVLILCGDCPLITATSISRLLEKPLGNHIRLFGFTTDNPGRYGRLITEADMVSEIIEFKDASEQQKQITLCNSGIYYLPAPLLFNLLDQLKNANAQVEYYLTDIVKIAADHGITTTYQLIEEQEISGVNDKLELAVAENLMQQRLRDKAMLDGVTMLAPPTVSLSVDTKFGKNVILKQNVIINNNVTIGDNVTIGPFAHIRPGTVLCNNASIGNFVEIKKSTIGENSKINHLSYIGDATLGKNVNIGAGTITCNYDGHDKHSTKIGDDVFVGSNSALVAPVTLGKGSIIAAGSAINKDVPDGALGIARALQKNLADWALRFKKEKKK